jgi:hypothetical protein
MPINQPKYEFDSILEDESCFVYLIGSTEGDMFKFGVSKTPEKRLNKLKKSNYCEDLGFPVKDSEILYVSELLPRAIATQIEAGWLIDNKNLAPYDHNTVRELTIGSYDEVFPRFTEYCNSWANQECFELRDRWLMNEFAVFNFFTYPGSNELIVYVSSTYRPLIDVAKVYRSNRNLSHIYSFWGGYRFIGHFLHSLSRKMLGDHRFLIIDESLESVMDKFDDYYKDTARVTMRGYQFNVAF